MTTIAAHLLPATLDVRLSLQNRYADDRIARDLAEIGVSNRAVTISGRATLSGKEITLEDFVAATPGAIRTTFTRFLAEHQLPRANDVVILDMEPTGFAPRALGECEGRQQRDLIAAYRRRIRLARDVLQESNEPGLRLGLYQVIVPDGRGQTTDEFERRMCGYLEAGRQGMYDELDFICPVLYQRFGTDDAAPETLRKWIVGATRQGLKGSLALTDRKNARIPLVPILSFWVFNGRSTNNRQAVSPISSPASSNSCTAPTESPPQCSGQDGRPPRRWSLRGSPSSRSTSSSSCAASARRRARGPPRRPPNRGWSMRAMVAVDGRYVGLGDEQPVAGAGLGCASG